MKTVSIISIHINSMHLISLFIYGLGNSVQSYFGVSQEMLNLILLHSDSNDYCINGGFCHNYWKGGCFVLEPQFESYIILLLCY